MDANGGHRYTVEVRPSRHDPGRFTWAIRDRGKLVRGSYRPHASAQAARAVALAEVARLVGPAPTPEPATRCERIRDAPGISPPTASGPAET